MTLAQALVICLFYLVPLIGSGPLWVEFVDDQLENCNQRWWHNLLYIQNFSGPYDICLYHTWILAVMMQMFVLTAAVLCVMSIWPAIGILSNILIILVSSVIVGVVTGVSGYPATFAVYFYDYRTAIKLWKYIYVQAYNHIGPFCIGMLAAFCTAQYSHIKIKKPIVILGWTASIVTCTSIVFGLYCYRDGHDMDRGLAIFYAAVHRPAWAMALSWFMFAHVTGHAGIAGSILCWKALIPFERLCYLAFLIHLPFMFYRGGIQREKIYMGHFDQTMCFISYLVVSFFVSWICYILFQAPYLALESWIFSNQGANTWQISPSESEEKSRDENDNKEMAANKDVLPMLFMKQSENADGDVDVEAAK